MDLAAANGRRFDDVLAHARGYGDDMRRGYASYRSGTGGDQMKYLLLLLAGCATKPATQEVKIPVYTKCVLAMPIKPAFEV